MADRHPRGPRLVPGDIRQRGGPGAPGGAQHRQASALGGGEGTRRGPVRAAPRSGRGEAGGRPDPRGRRGWETMEEAFSAPSEGQGDPRGISSSAPGSLRAAARGAGRRGVCCSLSFDVSLRCPNLGARGSSQRGTVPAVGPKHGPASPATSPRLAESTGSPVLGKGDCPSPSPPPCTRPCRHHGLHIINALMLFSTSSC